MKGLRMCTGLGVVFLTIFCATAAWGDHMSPWGEGFALDPLGNHADAVERVEPGSDTGMEQEFNEGNSVSRQDVDDPREIQENTRTQPGVSSDSSTIQLAANSGIGELDVTMEIVSEDTDTTDDIINTIELPVRVRERARDRERTRSADGGFNNDNEMEGLSRNRMEERHEDTYEYREDSRGHIQENMQDSMNEVMQGEKAQKGK
jgi:hypothetical protein